MKETERRIEAYKKLLPGIREKITAAAMLLVISVITLTSASFAWLTISRAPEVTAVSTNIAANGSLEIALATGDGRTAPGESKVGDSMSAEVDEGINAITRANITWGNLINLNDASYGLDNLVLRPAQLNTASFLKSPLYGAVYSQDGRITQLTSNFGYTTWNLPEGDKPGYFGVSEDYGVRAISSTKIEAVGAAETYYRMKSEAEAANLAAANMYLDLGNNDKYMPSLATMMGLYMTARMNPSNADLSNPTCNVADIQNLRDMYAAFLDCFDKEAEAMAALANLQLFLMHGDGNYTPYTAEMIYATTTAKLNAEGIQITNLDQFIKDRNIIVSDLEKLKEIASSGTSLKWKDSGLNDIVNNLVDVGKCTIGADNTPISSIGASNAMSYLSGTQEAKITNGILYRFEERTGGYIQVKNLSISATVERKGITIPASVKANVQTTAPRDYNLFTNDLTYAESLNTGDYKGGTPVAEDTYGLAVDFWIRTNSAGSYLTLEGNVLTESKMVRATGKDPDGNTVELYTVTISGTDENEESFSYSMDLYKVEEEGKEKWYNIDDYGEITEEELGDNKPTPKMVEVITVIGYEGDNRVWSDVEAWENNPEGLSVDSTTQGSGSCYVYYADTPEDMERSLKLLESFNVAFVDDEGKLMATAEMDTKNYYAASGRVTVPLVLSTSDSINLGEDYEGNVTYAITALEQNEPTRITAIVYLDGTKLTNSDVLSAADIQGQLNIQFGSSQSLEPIDNEELAGKELRVSASVNNTEFDYDTATEPMASTFTVNVDGAEPSSVTAYLIRKVSATQGSRVDADPDAPGENPLTFTKNAEGEWTCDYTFKTPGVYILRTVSLEGVDYDLDPNSLPTVTVEGFAIDSFRCSEATNNRVNVMTAANSTTVNLELKFATNDPERMPRTVQARFLNEEGTVNADFTYNSTTGVWSATATFLLSGEYTLQYILLDGEYTELDQSMWQTANITLGMRVAVYTTSPHTFKYVPSEMTENQKRLGMQVKIMDNAGEELRGLSGVKLSYGMKGSAIKKMDADLTWAGEYYVGEFATERPGIWQFSNVEVGANVLTVATTSPTFTIQSPEPPEYDSHNTKTYQYAPSNNATMNVVIGNSSAASVQAYIIKDGAAEGVWVDGTIGQETTTDDEKPANYWNFAVPKDANGYQDGRWTLTKLRLWDVFAADGTAYTEEELLVIDVSDTNNVTKVVARVFVTFAPGQNKDFGKDENGNVTGAFMQEYTVSGISVSIKDFENAVITGISDVKLSFVYGNNSSSCGGYTSASLTNAVADFTIEFTDSGDRITFNQSGSQILKYAGSYTATFSFKVGSQTISYTGDNLPANTPEFTVSSVKPSATISAITPTEEDRPTKITYKTDWKGTPTFTTTDEKTSFFSDYSATVYALAKADNSTRRHGTFEQPTLTITVHGNAAEYTAKLILPAGSATEISFEKVGNGAIKKTLGSTSQIKTFGLLNHTLWAYYGHETQKITTMTLTKGDMTYTVTLDNPLTITNPSSVNQ